MKMINVIKRNFWRGLLLSGSMLAACYFTIRFLYDGEVALIVTILFLLFGVIGTLVSWKD